MQSESAPTTPSPSPAILQRSALAWSSTRMSFSASRALAAVRLAGAGRAGLRRAAQGCAGLRRAAQSAVHRAGGTRGASDGALWLPRAAGGGSGWVAGAPVPLVHSPVLCRMARRLRSSPSNSRSGQNAFGTSSGFDAVPQRCPSSTPAPTTPSASDAGHKFCGLPASFLAFPCEEPADGLGLVGAVGQLSASPSRPVPTASSASGPRNLRSMRVSTCLVPPYPEREAGRAGGRQKGDRVQAVEIAARLFCVQGLRLTPLSESAVLCTPESLAVGLAVLGR